MGPSQCAPKQAFPSRNHGIPPCRVPKQKCRQCRLQKGRAARSESEEVRRETTCSSTSHPRRWTPVPGAKSHVCPDRSLGETFQIVAMNDTWAIWSVQSLTPTGWQQSEPALSWKTHLPPCGGTRQRAEYSRYFSSLRATPNRRGSGRWASVLLRLKHPWPQRAHMLYGAFT